MRPGKTGQSKEKALQRMRPVRLSGFLGRQVPLSFSGAISFLLAITCLVIFRSIIFSVDAESVRRLLAQAYTERRSLELRIAGAAHAQLRQERGSAISELEQPESLSKAESAIREQLSKSPNDPEWLQAKARFELLDHNFGYAIQLLHHAQELQPNSPQLLTDLATGYFEQAQKDSRAIDYGNAVEYLGEALALKPDDPVALFNRAIASEKIFLYTQATEDWENYLKIDSSGGWAEEARRRLAKVKDKVEPQERAMNEPLLKTSEIAKLQPHDVVALQRIDERVEEYVQAAVSEWLPAGYPLAYSGNPQVRDARSALRILAHSLKQRHRDNWLDDLLSADSSPDFPRAAAELSQTLKANDGGNTDAAQEHAKKADRWFTAAHNRAGALRARVEYIFAGHVAQDGRNCLQAAEKMRPNIEGRSYRWLQSQYHLEFGTCLWLSGNLGQAQEFYEKAEQETVAAGYKALYLRTQDHLAAFERYSGDFRASWERLSRALERFWSESYPAMRGYNLYYNLEESAGTRKQVRLRMSAWRDGLVLSKSLIDPSLRAMAHSLMMNAALDAGDPARAMSEFKRADADFKASPPIKATHVAQLEAETRLAEVEIKLGQWNKAAGHLPALEPEVAQLSDNFLGLLYYTTLGELQSHYKDVARTETSLRNAIVLAEKDLHSLKDPKARLEWSQRSSPAYRNLVYLQLQKRSSEQALEIWEWYLGSALRQGKATASSAHGASPPILQRARSASAPAQSQDAGFPELQEVSRLRPALADATVLSFMRVQDQYVGWAYDDRGVVPYKIPATSARIDTLAGSFRRLCSDPKSDMHALRQQARSLYDLLIGPAEAMTVLRRSLIIEADGALDGIAFEALLDPQGRYLAERNSITSSLGLYYRSQLHPARPITPDSRALVAAVPMPKFETETTLQFLPDAIEEGRQVKSKFHSAKILPEQDATMETVRSELPGAEVFHFAGHAVASERKTGLLLWDALFDSAALKNVDLKDLQLAVLSGCDTAGEITGTEYNPDNLVHPFIFAGVPRVVASRWNVDSTSTRQFMELFYRDLLGGKTVAAALSSAGAGLRATKEHPYYWAAFTEFGVD